MVSWIKRLRTNLYGTTRPIRTHRLATTRLRTEQLEGRWMPAVDITSFSVAAGTVTFTGDQNGSTTDDLYLSEVNVGGEVRLSHNLEGAGGTGVYADSTDVDPTAGVAHLVLGTGTAPLISVNLVSTDDVLTLDPAWTFTHLVAFDGGSGNDMLFGADSAANYTISGSGSGNINGTSAFTFAGL